MIVEIENTEFKSFDKIRINGSRPMEDGGHPGHAYTPPMSFQLEKPALIEPSGLGPDLATNRTGTLKKVSAKIQLQDGAGTVTHEFSIQGGYVSEWKLHDHGNPGQLPRETWEIKACDVTLNANGDNASFKRQDLVLVPGQ